MDTGSQKYVCVSVFIYLCTYVKGESRDGGRETEKQVKLNSVCTSSFPISLIVATFIGNSLIELTEHQATPGYSQSVWELQFYRNVMKFYTHVTGVLYIRLSEENIHL